MTSQQREALIHARYALDRTVSVIVGGDDIVLSTELERAIWLCIDAINAEIPEDNPADVKLNNADHNYVNWAHPSLKGKYWVAIDDDGWLCAFKARPILIDDSTWFGDGWDGKNLAETSAVRGDLPPYRDSLRERPK
jgi:hypothetical protein